MAWRMQKKRSLRAAGRIGVDNRGKRGRGRGRGRQRRKTEDGRQKTEDRRQQYTKTKTTAGAGEKDRLARRGGRDEEGRGRVGWGTGAGGIFFRETANVALRCVVLRCVAFARKVDVAETGQEPEKRRQAEGVDIKWGKKKRGVASGRGEGRAFAHHSHCFSWCRCTRRKRR
jgi:hypothetical protein